MAIMKIRQSICFLLLALLPSLFAVHGKIRRKSSEHDLGYRRPDADEWSLMDSDSASAVDPMRKKTKPSRVYGKKRSFGLNSNPGAGLSDGLVGKKSFGLNSNPGAGLSDGLVGKRSFGLNSNPGAGLSDGLVGKRQKMFKRFGLSANPGEGLSDGLVGRKRRNYNQRHHRNAGDWVPYVVQQQPS